MSQKNPQNVTPLAFVARAKLLFAAYYLISAVVLAAAFRFYSLTNDDRYARLLNRAFFLLATFSGSSRRTLHACMLQAKCLPYIQLSKIVPLYYMVSLLIIVPCFLYAVRTKALTANDPPIVIAMLAFNSVASVCYANYSSGGITVFGFTLNQIDASGSFVFGVPLMFMLGALSICVLIANVGCFIGKLNRLRR